LIAGRVAHEALQGVDAAEANLETVGAVLADLFDGLGVAIGELALLSDSDLILGGVERQAGEYQGTDGGECGGRGGGCGPVQPAAVTSPCGRCWPQAQPLLCRALCRAGGQTVTTDRRHGIHVPLRRALCEPYRRNRTGYAGKSGTQQR
jgi:hypothetical protein